MLNICLLGTGGMMPLPSRWLTALLVRHNGKMLLIDCGEGTQIPLKQIGWGCKSIEAICLTHYHADHVSGLPGLLLTIGNSGRTEPLLIMGPPGLSEVIAGLTVIAPELPYELKLEELPDGNCAVSNVNDMIIHSLPVDHTLTCLAYCIEIKRAGKFDVERANKKNIPLQFWSRLQRGEEIAWGNKVFSPGMVLGEPRKGLKICYCTDTRPVEALVDFAKDCDLFICEGMYGEDDKLKKALEKKHMLFSEAAQLAVKCNASELWLTHFSPSLAEPEKYLDLVKNIFPSAVVGKDMMSKMLKME